MSAPEDDDALDMDDWMAMSDSEQEAEVQRSMGEYAKWYDALSVADQQHVRIRSALRLAVRWRRLRRDLHVEIASEYLKKSQMRLLKLRAWRQTGIYPGEG